MSPTPSPTGSSPIATIIPRPTSYDGSDKVAGEVLLTVVVIGGGTSLYIYWRRRRSR
jgi:hypothetical protein